ncbi:MAG: polysaccharide biosynthesis C-terminal domain-containing protein [Fulvivirga sp.]|uniref:lipopolysaccharide biosynthesis protein n=1 Tax=Fulvivirga sp. TaxID=1931237 RepID=UPI0032EF1D18
MIDLKKYNSRILVLVLRVLTIGVRFLFNLLIIKDLSLEEYGTYAIFYTSISLSVITIGLDYYSYNTREILKASKIDQRRLIGDQLILHLFTYLVFIPSSFVILNNFIPLNYLFVFYLILVFEHLSQEAYRLFIAYSMPIFANFIQFIKMAMWCVIVIGISFFRIDTIDINLESIFNIWLTFVFLSVIISGLFIWRKNLVFFEISRSTFNRISNGVKVSFLFFISTMLFKCIEFSSRYFLDYFTTKAEVAIFTFFSNISNLIYVTVHSTSIVIIYPQLIKTFNSDNSDQFNMLRKRFLKEILIISWLVFFIILIFTPYLLEIIEKEALQANFDVLVVLLIGMMFFIFSYYPHYMLYLQGRDKSLLASSVIAAFTTIILNYFLTKKYGIYGSSYATTLGFMTLFFVKFAFLKKDPKKKN